MPYSTISTMYVILVFKSKFVAEKKEETTPSKPPFAVGLADSILTPNCSQSISHARSIRHSFFMPVPSQVYFMPVPSQVYFIPEDGHLAETLN